MFAVTLTLKDHKINSYRFNSRETYKNNSWYKQEALFSYQHLSEFYEISSKLCVMILWTISLDVVRVQKN